MTAVSPGGGYIMPSCQNVHQSCGGRRPRHHHCNPGNSIMASYSLRRGEWYCDLVIIIVILGPLSWPHTVSIEESDTWEQVHCDWYYCCVTKLKLNTNYKQSFISIIYNRPFDSTNNDINEVAAICCIPATHTSSRLPTIPLPSTENSWCQEFLPTHA